uniref:Ubiquitin-like domain-containing protein n=1 Tax=Anopheles culicifacies TaxID=139723 RepID=A0A182MMG7_9DIPT
MDVTLIVKASNQQCEDLTIKCEPSWTIRRLKGHLTEVYPGKPSTDEQKLIYSGQLLGDSVVLKDVLRQYDGQQAHTVHLVFTPKNSYYGAGGSNIPFVPIVQSTAMAGGFPNFAYYPCMASAPYGSGFPSTSNIPTASSDASNAAGPIAGVLPGVPSGPNHFLPSSTHPSSGMAPSPSGSQIPSPQISGMVNPTASSSIEASEGNGATTPTTTAGGSETATVAPVEQGGAPQDAAPAAAAPARARRFPNIVVEEQENNDWLDVFFSMCRVGILITVIYLYSSPMRCLTVLFIGVMLYLKKHLDRVYQAIDRRIPRLQPAPDANGVAQREQQPAVAQPNNNVPAHNPEQQLPNEPNVAGAAGVEAKARSSETENVTAGTSDQQQGSSSNNDASTSGRTVAPRPRTGSASRSAAPTARTVEEDQQQQQTERINSDGEPAAAEQPAAEGQRMTFNDMTSFLGTLVITFFTSIIPDTPAA